ncbi:MAG: cytochrome c oxidase subunit II [Fidelibacterota bacterium]
MLELLHKLGLPENFSVQGVGIDATIEWIHILMFVLFFIWAPFFIYTLVRFRRSRNPQADYVGVRSHVSSYLEGGVALFEAALLIGFAFPVWEERVNNVPPPNDKDAIHVRVLAQQFQWNVQYAGEDDVFGINRIDLIDDEAQNFIGLDRSDSSALDDVLLSNELHLPVNRPAVIYLSSKDVIHSFFLPTFRVKQDAIPGMRIPISFQPTQTGYSEIACAQLCGNSHYRMKGYLYIHTLKGYQSFINARSTLAKVNDYDLGFEAEKKLKAVMSALRLGDSATAERLAAEAQQLATKALEDKAEGGGEDWDEWGEEEWDS